ncbi:MAG TPA: C4-dicarboxylic acid transporter DauA, partial [Vicinamibacteria bacterium]|nr:C4-dicarboxylic acid transporter DauA [Vicinamibacteria bacterium]
MSPQTEATSLHLPPLLRTGAALRAVLRQGYDLATFRHDAMAGLVVGVVALPLSMALAIASGVPPQHGLYTAIVGGAVVALLGGSRVQVSGPTAAFVAILVPIATRFGLGGLLLATTMAGVLLLVLGAAGMGRLVEFVPYPVTTGFISGVAVVIATLQLRDFLGLSLERMPEHYLDGLGALAVALPTARWPDFAVGLATLTLLIAWPRLNRHVPAPLAALALAGVAAYALSRLVPGFEVATIHTRFSYVVDGTVLAGIPRRPPMPVLPWQLPSASGEPIGLSLDLVRDLAPAAFAIAVLGAIESLLSAVVADGMTGHKHDPDAELIAQGVGNLVAPFFGGIAATGAIARTATNVRAGARSPVAAVVHSLFVLAAVLLLAPALGFLPVASLAALLLVVAWHMGEWRHFVHVVRVAPRSDVVVLLSCFFLTIVFDMVVSVTVGIVMAALLFMRRMAEVSGVTLVGEGHPALDEPLPRGGILSQIAGPLFFGAA